MRLVHGLLGRPVAPFDTLDARYSERREVPALIGYRVATPLPGEVSRDEVQAVPFPAYLLDCGVRLLTWNHLEPAMVPVVAKENPDGVTPCAALPYCTDPYIPRGNATRQVQ